MSLKGLTVAVTASRRASELARLIIAFGGQPYFAPTVGINATRDVEEIKKFIDKIFERPDFLIFMSGPGVYSLMSIAKRLGVGEKLRDALKAVSLIARSAKPQAVLAKYDIHTKLIPHENTTEGILNLLKVYGIMGKKIGILWHGSYSKCFVDELSRAGAELFELTIYKYSYQLDNESATILREMGFSYLPPDETKVIKLIEDVNKGIIDVITFTSPPAAKELFIIAEKNNLRQSLKSSLNNFVIVTVVGPSTRKVLEDNAVSTDVMPISYRMGSMIKSLSDYVGHNPNPSKRKKHRSNSLKE
ncbi:MAG: uroporphyrinogen-III synthase [Nitrososphaeraceae archaeon]